MKHPKTNSILFSIVLLGLFSTNLLAQFKDSHATYKKYYENSLEAGSKMDRAWYHYTVEKTLGKSVILKIYNPELALRTHFFTYKGSSLKEKEGVAKEWFDNGSRIYEGQYHDNLRTGKWQFFDYYTNKNTWSGNFENGWEVGEWVELDSSGRKTSLVQFTTDKTIAKYFHFDENGMVIDSGTIKRSQLLDDALFVPDYGVLEYAYKNGYSEAVRPGCEALTDDERRKCSDNKFLATVYSQIAYPTQAVELGIEGTAYFDFIINEKGKLTKIVVLRGISKDITEECLKIIQALGPWVPGTKDGVPVKTSFKLPVKFKLE